MQAKQVFNVVATILLTWLALSLCALALSGIGCTSPTAHDGTVKLKWTATGDDGIVGTASEYDLRFSLSPITQSNFFDATRAAGLPIPGLSGTAEQFTLEGLTIGATYYLAIRVRDESHNWSAISNVLEVDGVSPAALVLELDI